MIRIGSYFIKYTAALAAMCRLNPALAFGMQNLPSFDDEHLKKIYRFFGDTRWHLFSKHTKKAYQDGNIKVSFILNDAFVEDMANSKGVLCGAGFETPVFRNGSPVLNSW